MPDWTPHIQRRLFPLKLSPTREAAIIDELSQHLEDRYQESLAGGATEEEAVRLALADFRPGNALAENIAPLKQAHAPAPPVPGESAGFLRGFWQDVRYAVRTFARQRRFAAAAIVTVALGVGANAAIFSVVRGVLLESLPFKSADRLYRLRMIYPDGSRTTTLSAPDFMSLRESTRVFDRVEAYTAGAVTMLDAGDPQEVRAVSVTDGLFDLLGMTLATGRSFDLDEHRPGNNRVAILDHAFWLRTFGGDDGAIGRSIRVGGGPYVIVGVLAKGVRLPADVPGARVPSDAELYLPIAYSEAFSATAVDQRRSNYLGVLATARADATPASINEDLSRIATDLQAAFPGTNARLSMDAISARDLIVGDVRAPLLILFGAVGLVLLIACANVANLMLVRASVRREELAVRAALGASRIRLLRQLLTEALVLGSGGGALGLGLAWVATEALVAANPADIPRLDSIGLDRTVVLFTFGVTLVASLVFGALPAMQATDRLARGLRNNRRGGADRATERVRGGLVVAEVALAMALLAGAGLLLRSLHSLTRVVPGFEVENVATFRVSLYGRAYDSETVRQRATAIESALRSLPGATAVGMTSVLPLSGPGPRLSFVVRDGTPPPDVNLEIGVASVSPAYRRAIGASLANGRDFTSADNDGAPLVAIVNQAAVRRWFPDGDAVGKYVRMNGDRQVVGVVADLQQGDPKRETAPQLFLPYAQSPVRSLSYVVRSGADPLALTSSIRAAVKSIDPELAVSGLGTLERLHTGVVARPRFYAMLLAVFALVALTLSVVGVFGVVSYAVAERTREIGIRIALGAQPADVLRMIVGKAVILALAGAGIGLAGAWAFSGVLRGQLFGVGVNDAPTFLAVALLLVTSVAAASAVPAHRASRLDPGSTLRQG